MQQSKDSITAKNLTGEYQIVDPEHRRTLKKDVCIEVIGASENNLKKINVNVPLGGFVCVTGVSGSGKSTLVNEIILKGLKPASCTTPKERPGNAYEKFLACSTSIR